MHRCMKHASFPAAVPTFCPPFSSAPPLGLCEFVSCWAQTPAPRFLPHSPSSGRSGTHSGHVMYIIRSHIHKFSHSSQEQADLLRVLVCFIRPSQRALTEPCCQHLLTDQLKINMWQRRVCCAPSLHLCAFIIPDAGPIHILFRLNPS